MSEASGGRGEERPSQRDKYKTESSAERLDQRVLRSSSARFVSLLEVETLRREKRISSATTMTAASASANGPAGPAGAAGAAGATPAAGARRGGACRGGDDGGADGSCCEDDAEVDFNGFGDGGEIDSEAEAAVVVGRGQPHGRSGHNHHHHRRRLAKSRNPDHHQHRHMPSGQHQHAKAAQQAHIQAQLHVGRQQRQQPEHCAPFGATFAPDVCEAEHPLDVYLRVRSPCTIRRFLDAV
eukprot:6186248-Pleurochrysis_carterae.AAC.1